MSEKERNELFDKIVIGLQSSTEAMLREKKSRGQKVAYIKPNGKVYTITARTALKHFIEQTNR